MPPSLSEPILAMWLLIEAGWPGWLVVCAALLIGLYAWWGYRLMRGRLPWAVALACLRGAGLLAVLLLVLRPVLLIPRQRTEKPVLAVVFDVSASMARRDEPLAERAGANLGRLEAAIGRLTQGPDSLLRRLAGRFELRLAACSDRVSSRLSVAGPADVPAAVKWLRGLRPDGSATDLAGSVREVFAALPDKPLAGLVLVSDGRSTAGEPLSDTAETLASLRCPPIAVIAGSTKPMPDVRILGVEAPQRLFVGEPGAVRIALEADGLQRAEDVRLTLSAEPAGRILAERTVTLKPSEGAGPAASEVELAFRPDRPGRWPLRIAVGAATGETNLQNNTARLQVQAVSQRIRVLYVDGYPRYEYRYLKNLLLREPTVISSCLLLSADPGFPQEGDEPIQRFPRSLEEFDRYDVVLIGDVDPKAGWVEPQALRALAEWVVRRGGGIGWIAGANFGLDLWRETPLERLLPVRLGAMGFEPAARGPYRLRLTGPGRRSALFRLTTAAAPAQEVIDRLAEWYWCAPVDAVSPAAKVLAVHPRWRTAEGPVPVVVIGHYGAGRTFFCGSDDVWRWRRYKGIEYYNAFWLQALRWLAGPRKLGAYRRVVLEASPERARIGEPISLSLRVRDGRLAVDLPDRIRAVIHGEDGAAIQVFALLRTGKQTVYTGSTSLQRAGRYTIRVELPAVERGDVTADLEVVLPEPETADTPADRRAMRQWVDLAKRMGADGYLLGVEDLPNLEALPLAGPSVRSEAVIVRLWDNVLALLLVGVLLLSEWALRRARGLA